MWVTYRNRGEIIWEEGDQHSGDKISEFGEYAQVVAKITCSKKRLVIFYAKENKTYSSTPVIKHHDQGNL